MLAQHPFLWLVLAGFAAFGFTMLGVSAWLKVK